MSVICMLHYFQKNYVAQQQSLLMQQNISLLYVNYVLQ